MSNQEYSCGASSLSVFLFLYEIEEKEKEAGEVNKFLYFYFLKAFRPSRNLETAFEIEKQIYYFSWGFSSLSSLFLLQSKEGEDNKNLKPQEYRNCNVERK